MRTLVSFFCLIRPAFLGATERTPGLVVLAGLERVYVSLIAPWWVDGTVGCGFVGLCLSVSGTYFLPGAVGPAFFNDPCTIFVLGWEIGMEGIGRSTQEKEVGKFL